MSGASSGVSGASFGVTREVVGACPLDCPDGCSWVITVDDDGSPTKIRGSKAHPFTAGSLCQKVNPWLEYAADPSRLVTPLRRSGPKGSGQFTAISWDDALAEIAGRLLDIRHTFGGEAIWPFVGTGHMGWVQGASGGPGARLWNMLGASNHLLSICSISGHVGLGYTMGTAVGMDPEAVADAGLVLLWGTNTLVANRHFWPFVEMARRGGAPLVVIDPARTRTTAAADLHVALRPGTDGALALGLCRAVVESGGADQGFIDDRSLGWAEFEASLRPWTASATAEVCGVDPATVIELAELIIEHPSLAVKLGQGMQRHAGGGQAARVISCLPAITGAFTQQGGGLVYSTSPAYGLDSYAVRRPDLRPGPVRSLPMTKLAATLLEADPAVRAIVMIGANPLVSNPDIGRVRKGLERPDLFTVAVELFPTETTAYADIVLPSAMQHEQLDLTESYAHLYLNWNEPAVPPPGACLAHTEMFRRLASVMAERDPAFADPLLQASDLELAEAALAGIPEVSVAQLRSDGFARLPGTVPYRPFADSFPTMSGRFEFASERAAVDGHGRLPSFVPAEEAAADPGARYTLIARGSSEHVNSVFAGTDRVRRTTTAPPIRVHPDDARRDGLVDDDRVEVSNERGRFVARIVVSDTGRPGLATISKGWWRQQVNATVREADSDMGNGAVFHDNVVDITKLPLAEPLFMKGPAR